VKEQVRFEAPIGGLLIRAFREEANVFEREDKPNKAAQYRRWADRHQYLTEAMKGKLNEQK